MIENEPIDIAGENAVPRHNDLSATGFYGAAATLAVFILGGWLTAHDAAVRLTEQVDEMNRHILAIEMSVNKLDLAIRPYPQQQESLFVPDATRIYYKR